jgi:TonB family protein
MLLALRWLGVSLLVNAGLVYGFIWNLLHERDLEKADVPQEVEVTWVEAPTPSQEITLPESLPQEPAPPEARLLPPPPTPPPPQPLVVPEPPQPKPPEVAKVKPPEPPKPEPPKPVKPPEKQAKTPELALIQQPKPPPPPPPAQPPPPQPPQPKAQIPKERHKMVEVDDDKHVVNEPPPEAAYLSDKNRRVEEQTRDTRTNLEQTLKGKASASEKSEDTSSEDVGGKEQKVHQLEKAEASSLDKKDLRPTEHNGKKDDAKGVLSGTKGEAGKGESGARGEGGKPGALSMRNVQGLGAPGGLPEMSTAPAGQNDDAPAVAQSQTPGAGASGRPGREGKAGKPGQRGPKLQITMDDYQRIVGKDKIDDEAQLAQRQTSHKKGRWEKKMDQIHASLENFTPEVKPGNQTALGTRAAPFAVFIARMHRKIHELWGFGFLEDLDGKANNNPMNDRKLEVTLEIVLNGDGTLDKATIVKPSGVLTFDVAAIDTVQNAGPFESPPESIRSGNGKIYLHWAFHRDERQCSPYFADPFILDNAGAGQEASGAQAMDIAGNIARQRQAQRISRNASPTEGGVVVPHISRTPDQEAAAARATVNTAAADDPIANAMALKWANAFESGQVDTLVALSGFPFTSSGAVVANDPSAVAKVWANVIGELSSRKVQQWKLFSAAGYRAVFGRLPKGGEDGTNRLFLAVRVGKEWLTMDVVPDAQGQYQVRGLTR